MLRALGATWMLAALLVTASARAQAIGEDEVGLKNGGSIRGTVVSSEPGTSVRIIEMGQTTARTIPWSEVAGVEKGKYAPRVPAPTGPVGFGGFPIASPIAAPPPAHLGDPGVVRLHVTSPEPVVVYEHSPQRFGPGGYGYVFDTARVLCNAPCDRVVDGTAGRYFTARGNFPGEKRFEFGGMRGDYELEVNPGSKAMRTSGLVLMTAGGGAALIGALFAPIGFATDTTVNKQDGCGGACSSTEANTAKSFRVVGLGGLIGGGIAVVAGVTLFLVGGTGWALRPAHPTGSAAAPWAISF